jgi:hypothetical protein
MIFQVSWDGLSTLSFFGLSQFHGHSSWLVCEVALSGVSLSRLAVNPRLDLVWKGIIPFVLWGRKTLMELHWDGDNQHEFGSLVKGKRRQCAWRVGCVGMGYLLIKINMCKVASSCGSRWSYGNVRLMSL